MADPEIDPVDEMKRLHETTRLLSRFCAFVGVTGRSCGAEATGIAACFHYNALMRDLDEKSRKFVECYEKLVERDVREAILAGGGPEGTAPMLRVVESKYGL